MVSEARPKKIKVGQVWRVESDALSNGTSWIYWLFEIVVEIKFYGPRLFVAVKHVQRTEADFLYSIIIDEFGTEIGMSLDDYHLTTLTRNKPRYTGLVNLRECTRET